MSASLIRQNIGLTNQYVEHLGKYLFGKNS